MQKPLRSTAFEYPGNVKPVTDPQVTYSELMSVVQSLPTADMVRFVRSYVQERTPAAFAAKPLLWEAVREFVAKRSGVHAREVGLSGSAQLGFGLAAGKGGTPFNPQGSDLDFFLVNATLFSAIEKEARLFISRQLEGSDFLDQAETAGRQIQRGYLDLNQVPANHERYPKIASARNDASIVIDRLRVNGYELKPSHFRVYRDWAALGTWVSWSYRSLR